MEEHTTALMSQLIQISDTHLTKAQANVDRIRRPRKSIKVIEAITFTPQQRRYSTCDMKTGKVTQHICWDPEYYDFSEDELYDY